MKKHIFLAGFSLITAMAMLFASCNTELNDNDKYIIQTPLYQIYEQGRQEYRYCITDGSAILAEGIKKGTEPEITELGNGIIRLYMGFGTNAASVQYFDVWNGRKSEVFSPYANYTDFANENTQEYLIAYFASSSEPVLTIKDIFDEQGFSTKIDKNFCYADCKQMIILNENEIYLDYTAFADGYSNEDLKAGKNVEYENIRETIKYR